MATYSTSIMNTIHTSLPYQNVIPYSTTAVSHSDPKRVCATSHCMYMLIMSNGCVR